MITYTETELFTRRDNTDATDIAFGCSHTWGVGVDPHETWSH
jgi:hypothetical protein